MNEEQFKLSLSTRIKKHVSTALFLVGLVGVFMAKTPAAVSMTFVFLLYSYLIGLDARTSAIEEVLKALIKPVEKSEEDESHGQ